MTHSIVAIFVSFILGTAVLGLPAVFFPKIELFKYFGLNFNFVLASDATVAQNSALVALGFIVIFALFGLIIFKKQDLKKESLCIKYNNAQ